MNILIFEAFGVAKYLVTLSDRSFQDFSTNNVAQPFSDWTRAVSATERMLGSGNYSFTDTQATNNRNFYRVM